MMIQKYIKTKKLFDIFDSFERMNINKGRNVLVKYFPDLTLNLRIFNFKA